MNNYRTTDNGQRTTDKKTTTPCFWSTVLCPLSTVLLLLCTHCSTSHDSTGVYHRVRAGEDLFWISKAYGVDLQDLAELNNIVDTSQAVHSGQKLYIPPKRFYRNKKLPFEGRLTASLERPKKKFGRRPPPEKIRSEHDRFIWPVEGTLRSPFGIRRGRRHDGIDIRAKQGTPVVAADQGRVVYAGTMRGYGNLILIRHDDNFFTAYAHNQANLVKEEENVKRGQTIGKVGRTGKATGAHLHFEVREGEKARNPLFFLPVMR